MRHTRAFGDNGHRHLKFFSSFLSNWQATNKVVPTRFDFRRLAAAGNRAWELILRVVATILDNLNEKIKTTHLPFSACKY